MGDGADDFNEIKCCWTKTRRRLNSRCEQLVMWWVFRLTVLQQDMQLCVCVCVRVYVLVFTEGRDKECVR